MKRIRSRANYAKKRFEEGYYVLCYELARDGQNDYQIANALGISKNTLQAWKDRRPALGDAIERGRKKYRRPGEEHTTFREYVYQRLPADLQDFWNKLMECEQDAENGKKRSASMLEMASTDVRKHLFLYALVHCNFNASEACRLINVSRSAYARWVDKDETFKRLMEEIDWHKKNFFEAALVGLVKEGNTNATIFANRTLNKDRGYSEKIDLNVNGTVNHNHAIINVDELDLPLEVRKQILLAVREKKKKTLNLTNGHRVEIPEAAHEDHRGGNEDL